MQIPHPSPYLRPTTVQDAARRRERLLLRVLLAGATIAALALSAVGLVVGAGPVLALVIVTIGVLVILRWPIGGTFILLSCIVIVDENTLAFNIFTNQLYVYSWPAGLEGFIERPIGLLMLFALAVLARRNVTQGRRALEFGPLFWPLLAFLGTVALGAIHGLVAGGDLKLVVVEVRPFWYLFLAYMLGYNALTTVSRVRAFLWVAILGAGVKGLQGVYIYLVLLHGNLTGFREILGHEESFFFVAVLLLVVLFTLRHRYGPQLWTAAVLLPLVLIALVANQRRADYLALLGGLSVAWLLVTVLRPERRAILITAAAIFVVLLGGYVLLFYDESGPVAAPARALVSIVQPSGDDALSNAYRVDEDFDLQFTALQHPVLGLGFGIPFAEPHLLQDLSPADPYYNVVPHNTILWVWMALGPLGYAALWYFFGSLIIRGCQIARGLRQPYLQVVAVFVVGVTVMEIIVAFADQQLFIFRNVIYLGLLAGMLLRLPSMDSEPAERASTTTGRRGELVAAGRERVLSRALRG